MFFFLSLHTNSLPSTQSPQWTTTLSSRYLLILTLPLFDLSPSQLIECSRMWLGLNWVLKLDHGAFMVEWRQRDWFGWWVGWIRGLCNNCWWVLWNSKSVVVVDWFGFAGCDRLLEGVVKHISVVGGCCETHISCW